MNLSGWKKKPDLQKKLTKKVVNDLCGRYVRNNSRKPMSVGKGQRIKNSDPCQRGGLASATANLRAGGTVTRGEKSPGIQYP